MTHLALALLSSASAGSLDEYLNFGEVLRAADLVAVGRLTAVTPIEGNLPAYIVQFRVESVLSGEAAVDSTVQFFVGLYDEGDIHEGETALVAVGGAGSANGLHLMRPIRHSYIALRPTEHGNVAAAADIAKEPIVAMSCGGGVARRSELELTRKYMVPDWIDKSTLPPIPTVPLPGMS